MTDAPEFGAVAEAIARLTKASEAAQAAAKRLADMVDELTKVMRDA